MKCEYVLLRLSAFADGELSAYRTRRIRRHLDGCLSCQARLAGLREVSGLLGGLPVPPVPEGLSARVMAEANRRARMLERPSRIRLLAESLSQGVREMSAVMRLAACGTVLAAGLAGVLTAERMFPTHGGPRAAPVAMELAGLEWFGSVPPASVAAVYLTVASAEGGAR